MNLKAWAILAAVLIVFAWATQPARSNADLVIVQLPVTG